MSEYQYYEFRTIDKPLTEEQKEEVASLSSRGHVTSNNAVFVYNYGDFRGDVNRLMSDYFDIMLYVTNWGTRRLMFRIPCSLIDIKEVVPFCISDDITFRSSDNEKYIILDLNYYDEEFADWVEGEGQLEGLTDLREELIHGDFRSLYLTWLKAAEKAWETEEIDEDVLEPPVPDGLKNLSHAQKAYATFWDIDEAMIAVAAQQSCDMQDEKIKAEKYLDKLPEKDKYDFLVRLSRGEKNLSILLNRRLHEFAEEKQPDNKKNTIKRRTISSLIEIADEWRRMKKEEKRKKDELLRQKQLELLAKTKTQVLNTMYSLIEDKNSSAYDKAVALLKDLHDLAQYQGDLPAFRKIIVKIQSNYPTRTALLRRMRDLKLIEE